MSDSRSRFEAWFRSKSPSVKDWFFGFNTETDGGYQSIWLQHQWEAWQAAEAETARRCAALCEKAEIQTVAAKGRETAARLQAAIKAEFSEAFK